jgi:hypothetical protein
MFALNQTHEDRQSNWQHRFVQMLPEIEQKLNQAFCRLRPEAREDSLAEGVAHCLLTYARLDERGRSAAVSPSSLAWYAALHVKRGRPAAGRMNSKEPLSRYAQFGRGIQVEHVNSKWIDALVEDKRAAVADVVAARIDFGSWFSTLSRRMRLIAKDLAFGGTTSEVARKHGVTAGRISQLRRRLKESWAEFQQESVPVVA